MTRLVAELTCDRVRLSFRRLSVLSRCSSAQAAEFGLKVRDQAQRNAVLLAQLRGLVYDQQGSLAQLPVFGDPGAEARQIAAEPFVTSMQKNQNGRTTGLRYSVL